MNADELFRQLRLSQIPKLVFLFGSESYLVQQAARAVRDIVLPTAKDDFNDNQFYGKDATAELILEAAMTYPVFAEKRLVTVKDAHQLPAAELDKLIPYLKDPVPQTCLLFIADKIDKRRKFFQQFKKSGSLIEFKPLSTRDIPRYIQKILTQRQLKISADGLDLFCLMMDGNLHEIHGELDKLQTYIGTATLIEAKDVAAVVSRGRLESVFELGNAVGRGDIEKSLSLIRQLGNSGEAPLKILSLLVRHFRQLWQARELQVKNCPENEIARVTGTPFFVVGDLIRQGKRFSKKDFLRAFELFLETDLAMKSSGANAGALLDHLILRLIQK